MDPRAREQIVPFLLRSGEGFELLLYLDEKGIVTTGVGNALFTSADALALDWRRPDHTPASDAEVLGAYAAVSARKDLAGHGAGAFTAVTMIRTTAASIGALIDRDIARYEGILRQQWAEWDAAPWPAQLALLRLAWACGPYFAPRWPKLHAAWTAKDWGACAGECRIPALDRTEPGANNAEAALFEQAAELAA